MKNQLIPTRNEFQSITSTTPQPLPLEYHHHSNTTTTDYSIEWTNYPRTGKKDQNIHAWKMIKTFLTIEWQNTPTYKSNQNTPAQ